jgi:hypothetical protein
MLVLDAQIGKGSITPLNPLLFRSAGNAASSPEPPSTKNWYATVEDRLGKLAIRVNKNSTSNAEEVQEIVSLVTQEIAEIRHMLRRIGEDAGC